jgi:hypothetical protein
VFGSFPSDDDPIVPNFPGRAPEAAGLDQPDTGITWLDASSRCSSRGTFASADEDGTYCCKDTANIMIASPMD